MKIALFGLGNIGRRHLGNLNTLAHDIAVCDPIDKLIQCNIQSFSENDLWEWRPDKVLICTPPDSHCSLARRAFQAGCDVFCEKPLALTVKDAESMCEAAAMAKKQLAVGYMLRAHPLLQSIKIAIDNGHYGQVYAAHFECCWQPKETSYPWPGVIAETSHELDLANWLLGPPREHMVCCNQYLERKVAQVLFHYDKALASFHLDAKALAYRRSVTIYGDKQKKTWMYGEDGYDWNPVYRDELTAFLNGMPFCTGEDGLAVVRMIEGLS